MSSPTNYPWLLEQINNYLSSRLSPAQLSSLSNLPLTVFEQLSLELNDAISEFNQYPKKLPNKLSSNYFLNANHLKKIIATLPSYPSTLFLLKSDNQKKDVAFSEMRDSTYFNFIYKIEEPTHLLANLMTLVYRCHMLSSNPKLRDGGAQISSTLEEMSALRHLMGLDSLHYQSTRQWILDWEGEGFSELLSLAITKWSDQ